METKSFVKQDSVSERLQDSINKIYCHNSYESISRLDPIHLTECPRRLGYKISKIEPDSYFLDCFDDIFLKNFKSKWIDYFKGSDSIRVIDTEVAGVDLKHNITSTIDAVVRMGDDISVTKLVPMRTHKFEDLCNDGPFKKDVIALMIEMWLLELESGILLYENIEGLEFTIFHVEPYQPIINSVRKKCNKIMEAHNFNGTIERGYDNDENKECEVCEFSMTCWGAKNEKEKSQGKR